MHTPFLGYTRLLTPVRRFGPFPFGENMLGEPLALTRDVPAERQVWEPLLAVELEAFRLAKQWALCTAHGRSDLWNRILCKAAQRLKAS